MLDYMRCHKLNRGDTGSGQAGPRQDPGRIQEGSGQDPALRCPTPRRHESHSTLVTLVTQHPHSPPLTGQAPRMRGLRIQDRSNMDLQSTNQTNHATPNSSLHTLLHHAGSSLHPFFRKLPRQTRFQGPRPPSLPPSLIPSSALTRRPPCCSALPSPCHP